MGLKVGVVLLFFLLSLSMVHAETLQEQSDAAVQASVDQANRYLTAEVSRQISAEKEQLSKELKDYQDENFGILDQRVLTYIRDTKNEVIVGSIGASALAGALTTMMLLYFIRRYSYEGYLKGLTEKQGKQILELQEMVSKDIRRDLRGINEMQAESRMEQVPTNTIAMQYGQAQAARMSEMNQWQNIPAYQGSWVPPRENVQQRVVPNWQPPVQAPPWAQPPMEIQEVQFDPMSGGGPQ